jgi:hypothetical protein
MGGGLGGSIDLLRLEGFPSLHGKPANDKTPNRGLTYCNDETPRRAPGNARGPQGQNAIASISTFTPLRGGAASTVVRAGCTPWKYSLKTRLNTGKSSMFRR